VYVSRSHQYVVTVLGFQLAEEHRRDQQVWYTSSARLIHRIEPEMAVNIGGCRILILHIHFPCLTIHVMKVIHLAAKIFKLLSSLLFNYNKVPVGSAARAIALRRLQLYVAAQSLTQESQIVFCDGTIRTGKNRYLVGTAPKFWLI
jgi:hypothetical protein